MTAKDFVENRLRHLTSIFKGIKIRYKHIPQTKSHLVEVIPSEFMQGNEDYFKEEAVIMEEFAQLFPSDSIDFITDESEIIIEKADLELYSR